MLYFEWSPPWHFKAFRALAQTLSYKSHSKTQHCFIWSKVFCGRGAQLTLQLISFHLAPVVGSSFLILISSSHACCIMLNSYQVSLGWNAVAKQHQQESNWWIPYLLTFFLAVHLVYLRRFFVVDVRRATLWSGARGWGPQGTLWSGACSWGPAITLIHDHFDPQLAVRVRQGILRSGACSCGPVEEGGGGRRRASWHII